MVSQECRVALCQCLDRSCRLINRYIENGDHIRGYRRNLCSHGIFNWIAAGFPSILRFATDEQEVLKINRLARGIEYVRFLGKPTANEQPLSRECNVENGSREA